MKSLWLILVLSIPMALFAQDTLKTKEVPDIVVQNFERRNRGVENTIWLKENDKFLVSYETRRGEEETKYYTKTGELEKTVKIIPLDELRSNMLEYIDSEFRNYTPYKAYYIEKGRRDRYYSILMHHRKADDPPDTEIQFDQSGRFLTVENLYFPEENTEEPEIDADFAEQVDTDVSEISAVEYGESVKLKELPSKALDYIQQVYPRPFRVKKATVEKLKGKPIYEVFVKKQGDDYYYALHFTFDGELLSDEKIYED
ncbi:MAG: PepSY-like domain-containing protein [Bacteroidales bacterium]